MGNELLLAIPVFNEQQYLADVLDEATAYCPDVLVIDDGSTDGTPQLLARREDVHVITHPENRGYGKSLVDAFDFACRHGFDWLVTMDCDEQHEPAQIPRFMEAARCDDADIISGTRYPNGWSEDAAAPADRRAINQEITELLNLRLGLGLTDAFCGFKAYRVEALRSLDITIPGYAMPLQFWVQVARAGLRVRELAVPLIYNDPTRHFGGLLDDPAARLAYYLEVFEAEWAAGAATVSGAECTSVRCS